MSLHQSGKSYMKHIYITEDRFLVKKIPSRNKYLKFKVLGLLLCKVVYAINFYEFVKNILDRVNMQRLFVWDKKK